MVLDPGAVPHTGNPQIEEARFAQGHQHANAVDHQRDGQHPDAFEDQEQLHHQHRVHHKEAVGHTREHLRSRERSKQRGLVKLSSHAGLPALTAERGATDTADDAGSPEQDETAKNYHGSVPPVDPAG